MGVLFLVSQAKSQFMSLLLFIVSCLRVAMNNSVFEQLRSNTLYISSLQLKWFVPQFQVFPGTRKEVIIYLQTKGNLRVQNYEVKSSFLKRFDDSFVCPDFSFQHSCYRRRNATKKFAPPPRTNKIVRLCLWISNILRILYAELCHFQIRQHFQILSTRVSK